MLEKFKQFISETKQKGNEAAAKVKTLKKKIKGSDIDKEFFDRIKLKEAKKNMWAYRLRYYLLIGILSSPLPPLLVYGTSLCVNALDKAKPQSEGVDGKNNQGLASKLKSAEEQIWKEYKENEQSKLAEMENQKMNSQIEVVDNLMGLYGVSALELKEKLESKILKENPTTTEQTIMNKINDLMGLLDSPSSNFKRKEKEEHGTLYPEDKNQVGIFFDYHEDKNRFEFDETNRVISLSLNRNIPVCEILRVLQAVDYAIMVSPRLLGERYEQYQKLLKLHGKIKIHYFNIQTHLILVEMLNILSDGQLVKIAQQEERAEALKQIEKILRNMLEANQEQMAEIGYLMFLIYDWARNAMFGSETFYWMLAMQEVNNGYKLFDFQDPDSNREGSMFYEVTIPQDLYE